MKIKKMNISQNPRRESDMDYNARKHREMEEIDHILDKIKQSGYSALSDAEKKKRILEAEGEAQAILSVQKATADGIKAIKEAGADEAVLTLKSLEAFVAAADGQATKIIIPSEIQGIAGSVKALAEVIKD